MKADRTETLDHLAISVLDPLSVPAALLDAQGRVLHHNGLWDQPSSTFGISAGAQWAVSIFEDADFAAFLDSQDPALVLSEKSRTGAFHAVRLRGTGPRPLGFMVLLLPRFGSDDLIRQDHLLANPFQGLWDINLVTGQRYHSEGWAILRGQSTENTNPNAQYERWLTRVHPNDLERFHKQRDALVHDQAECVIDEYRERHEDGHWIWVMSRTHVLSRDADGHPTRLCGFDTDISHLKIGSSYEDERERRLQLAIAAADFGIWEYDVDKHEVEWDQRTRAIYGITEPRLRWSGDLWATFLHPDDREQVLRHERETSWNGADQNFKFRILRLDGEVRHLRSRSTYITDQNGRTKLLGVTWDITADAERAIEIKEAYLLIQQRNEALEQAQAELEHRAWHDTLTGLANRSKLDVFFSRLLERAKNGAIRCAVLQFDLDYFKEINDSYGHATGDYVLQRAADILTELAPLDSVVARVGGDEFTILIAHAEPDLQIRKRCRRIIDLAEEPLEFEGNCCRFGFSIGVASGMIDPEASNRLFSQSDLALYDAKRAGRGVVRFYSPALSRDAQKIRRNREDLRQAIAEGQFGCFYQPQYDTTGQYITGIEALARWYHPTRGILAPNEFLLLAEEMGIVAKIDDQVLKTVLRDAQEWQGLGKIVPRIFVNVSGRRLMDPALPDRVAFLKDCGVRIGFELLETIYMDQADPHLKTNIAALRSLGIALDLDDFGSGHASILCLQNLRPDRIKIDRELVQDAPNDPEQRALVRAIVEIGAVMRMSVVAEGVETAEHVSILQELGCNYLQGFGLCRPQKAAVIVEMLHDA